MHRHIFLTGKLILYTLKILYSFIYVVLGIENQNKVHYAMAVKNMLYDALQYAKQVEEAKRSYRDRSKTKSVKLNSEEFDKFKTDLGSIMQFIKHQSDKDGSWIKGKSRFEHVEKEAVELINLITGSKIIGDEKEEVVDMCRAWENSINNAKNEGVREGKIEGKIEILYEECEMSIPDIAKKVSKPEKYVKEVIKKITAACL